MTTYEMKSEYQSPDHPLNLNEKNFRVAFNLRQIEPHTLRSLDDPRYIRRVISLGTWNNDTQTFQEKILPFHDCTDEEYAQFYPATGRFKEDIDVMRKYPDFFGLICLDWDDSDPLQLYG